MVIARFRARSASSPPPCPLPSGGGWPRARPHALSARHVAARATSLALPTLLPSHGLARSAFLLAYGILRLSATYLFCWPAALLGVSLGLRPEWLRPAAVANGRPSCPARLWPAAPWGASAGVFCCLVVCCRSHNLTKIRIYRRKNFASSWLKLLHL